MSRSVQVGRVGTRSLVSQLIDLFRLIDLFCHIKHAQSI